jgi:hypothetical protein
MYKSRAQIEKFYSDPRLRRYADEWLKTTPGKLADLPERVKPPPRRDAHVQGK